MLNIQIFRLSVAAIITIAFSELLIKGSALGWHQNVPGEVWLVAHGLAVALTVRNTAAPSAQLPRLYMTYFIIAKAGAILTCFGLGVVPPFISNPLDWFIYTCTFGAVFFNDLIFSFLSQHKGANRLCHGLSYVSTVYSITEAVKAAAEQSLHEVHAILSNKGQDEDICYQADWTMIRAVAWPIVLGTISACGAVFVLQALRISTSSYGWQDIRKGIANTFAWAAVCLPAIVIYDMATNTHHGFWSCAGWYRPAAMAHLEAETLVATWLLSNHFLEVIAAELFGPSEAVKAGEKESVAKAKKKDTARGKDRSESSTKGPGVARGAAAKTKKE